MKPEISLPRKRTPAIDITNLSYVKNGSTILDRVNLTIHENDFVVMIGPNGGGKTTLIKLILNLIKPTKGEITLFGYPSTKNNQNVSYVPQEITANKNFPITVMDVVLMGNKPRRSLWGFKVLKPKNEALKALEKMEVAKYRNRKIGELSGGQQQRVLIARALVAKPRLLFMDEPTANIDTNGQTTFYKLLKKINAKTTIIVTSHDLMVLSSYAKSVACVNQTVYFHRYSEITNQMLANTYGCAVELLAHGVPHRVLPKHWKENNA